MFWSIVATLVVAACLVVPSTSQAGQDFIGGSPFGPGGNFGPRHSLIAVQSAASGWACVNALNADGSGWAGSSYCAGPGQSTSHPYCGCKLRYGYVYTYYNQQLLAVNAWQVW